MKQKLKIYANKRPLYFSRNFNLEYNKSLDLYKTNPIPDNLNSFYLSDKYISHTDSSKNWLDKIYQLVKKISLHCKYKLLMKHFQKPKVLDFGCGTGDFVKFLIKKNIDVVGVEPNFLARKIAISKNIKVFENINEISNLNFDVITLWHVLEHIPDYYNQIEELKKLLNPNGIIIIAVPNFNSYDAKYYQKFWAAYDVPRHIWHFSKTSIRDLAIKTNFIIKTIKPLWFDSFYVSILSEKYKNKKQNILNAIYIGLLSNVIAIKTKEFSSLIYILKANE